MLTLNSILRTMGHMAAHGEGQHRFGKGTERIAPVPRDREARPKGQDEK